MLEMCATGMAVRRVYVGNALRDSHGDEKRIFVMSQHTEFLLVFTI